MKFSFKIQQYQTDAVDAVARVFQGQPYNAGVSYLRDMGNLSAQPQQLSLVSSGDDATQVESLIKSCNSTCVASSTLETRLSCCGCADRLPISRRYDTPAL